jgi:hypothetical protein
MASVTSPITNGLARGKSVAACSPAHQCCKPQWLRELSASQLSVLPAWQARVFAGSEWLGEALQYLGLLPQRLRLQSELLRAERSGFRLRARPPAKRLNLERPYSTRACSRNVVAFAPGRMEVLRMEKVGRTLLRASSFRWYRFQTVVEIKATHPVRRCRCEACRYLECRSFKNQNDGPLRFGRLFPAWSLSNVGC